MKILQMRYYLKMAANTEIKPFQWLLMNVVLKFIIMEAKDLRIGNYYHWHAEGKNYIYQVKPEDFIRGNIPNFEPIPITEGWFYKLAENSCICEKIKDCIIVFDRFRLIWKSQYNYWYVTERYSDTYLTKNEWQNFYKVMNGKELKID